MGKSKKRNKKVSEAEKHRRQMQSFRSQFRNIPQNKMSKEDVEVTRELEKAHAKEVGGPWVDTSESI